MRATVFFTLTLLTGVSVAQAKNPPVEIKDSRVWEHRLAPEEALHRSQQEMDELLKQSRFIFAHQTGECLFDVVVSAKGAVESFQLVESSQFCNPHQQEAESVLRSRSYQPWLVVGIPARVKIEDWVNIYPPERWGAPVPFPEKVDRSTLEFQLERTLCRGSCPSYIVSIAGDGTVRFDGRASVAIPGLHGAHISLDAVTQLIQQFRAANFLAALPKYRSDWTDNSTQTLSLHINGQVKTVVDYIGLEVGLPLAIRNLETALDSAAGTERWIKGNDETMASLQAEHWNFASPSADNLALYRKAIETNDTSLIDAFLHAKARVATAVDKAAPPLCEASRAGNLSLVNAMLQDAKDLPAALLNRCLADAAQSGSLPLVNLWLEKGADPGAHIAINAESDNDWIAGFGALAGAVHSGNAEIVGKLLTYKVDVNERVQEQPLLSWAIERGRGDTVEIVKLLTQAGADANAKNYMGQTPLFACMWVPAAIKPLIAAGADIEARDHNGDTVLIHDAFVEAMVRELLANDGADPTAVATNGNTALKRAAGSSCKPCADLIEAALKKNGLTRN
jgi:ankyrin repeat protein